jgi:hypothetical protein
VDQDHPPATCTTPDGIPLSLRIGVTGHRQLAKTEQLRQSVDLVLERLGALLGATPHRYTAVSPLAEGADRLVAQQVLAWPSVDPKLKPDLEVALPLPTEEYLEDFSSAESRAEFGALLARAARVRAAQARASRPAGYLSAGKQVVQSCDVLLAIWDGEPAAGSGGTAEMVAYARHMGRWLFWIHAGNGAISEENRPDTLGETIACLATYNRERIHPEKQDGAIASLQHTLAGNARAAGLDPNTLIPVWRCLLPPFVRADLLAGHFQRRHNLAVTGVTALAVLAVAIVTIQVLFFPHRLRLVWGEVAAMVLILSLLLISRRRQWHRKWIDYRFLAERLRAALFLAACGIECSPPRPLPHSVAHRPDDWMVKAFAWIWGTRPRPDGQAALRFEPLRDFLLTAWIRDQAVYYVERSRQLHRAEQRLTGAGLALFILTLIAAIVHVLGGEYEPAGEAGTLGNLLIAAAIILPALGAALADIRVHREYSRNAERYAHMARQMESLGQQIARTRTMFEMLPLLEEANEVMLREQQDWRVVVLFQEMEAP